MGEPRVAIVTMARAPSEVEVRRITEGLTLAAGMGLPVFVTDHPGNPGVARSVEMLPNVDLARQDSDMVARVSSSFRRALERGADVCVYTEPDKIPFFQSGLGRLVQTARQNPNALVIAARNASAFATVPEGQRFLESRSSEIASAFLGVKADYYFGPFAVPGEAVGRYLPGCWGSLGWGWRTYLMGRCIRDGVPVVIMEGSFEAPEWNRGEDDAASRLYRLKQFVESVEGVRQALLA